ncbi:TP53-target gene 5 protein [Orycteropus afer afer]|uniref:TP53-target gene 5 protein n=1 Tax=Orycteropus afer afer TaxID=1230840 RepID=A0A8B6ZLV2_ORYAF|nr:TP53-target gene 5 protein [Orycteropus afer afer]
MSPSAKKRPKNRVACKMQDEEPHGIREHSVSKVIEQNRLKMVLKNLSLLKLLKSSNPRIQELHNLAKRCWNSLFRVPKIPHISSGDNNVCNKVKKNDEELQEARCPKQKRESKKSDSIEEPKEMKPKKPKPNVGSGVRGEAKRSPEAVPQKEEQVKPEVPRTSRGPGLTTCPKALGSQVSRRGPRVVFLKTYHLRSAMGDMKKRNAADQWIWFEGLPTRIRLPGPRVMCRASTLRLVKRCCTRYCSATLELPMRRPYRASENRLKLGTKERTNCIPSPSRAGLLRERRDDRCPQIRDKAAGWTKRPAFPASVKALMITGQCLGRRPGKAPSQDGIFTAAVRSGRPRESRGVLHTTPRGEERGTRAGRAGEVGGGSRPSARSSGMRIRSHGPSGLGFRTLTQPPRAEHRPRTRPARARQPGGRRRAPRPSRCRRWPPVFILARCSPAKLHPRYLGSRLQRSHSRPAQFSPREPPLQAVSRLSRRCSPSQFPCRFPAWASSMPSTCRDNPIDFRS